MTNVSSIALAWGAVIAVIGVYLWNVMVRTRTAAKQVPVANQRWMSTPKSGGVDSVEGSDT